MTMKKRQPTLEEQQECHRLKVIFEAKKHVLKITQDKAAEILEMNQSSVNHYLNARNALNAHVAAGFSKLLQVPVEDFSPRLAAELQQLVAATTSSTNTTHDAVAALRALAGKATPRSQAVLDRLHDAAENGSLTEPDLLLLDQIASRLLSKPRP